MTIFLAKDESFTGSSFFRNSSNEEKTAGPQRSPNFGISGRFDQLSAAAFHVQLCELE